MVKQVVIQNRVMPGTLAEGLVHFERYTIGNQADKEAEDPNTFADPSNFGAMFFNQLLDVLDFADADIPDLEALLPTLVDMQYTGKIKKREGKDKSTGELTGKTYTNINRYFKLGTMPQQIDGEDSPKAQRPAPAARVLTKANGAAGAPRVATPARPAPRPAAPQPARTLPAGFSVEE